MIYRLKTPLIGDQGCSQRHLCNLTFEVFYKNVISKKYLHFMRIIYFFKEQSWCPVAPLILGISKK